MANTTDFTKQGNQVQVTITTDNAAGTPVVGPVQCYVGFPVRYGFDAAGTTLTVTFGVANSYTVPLSGLRVAGAGSAPVSVAAALTALSDVFGIFP